MKTKVLCDSTSYMTDEDRKKHNIDYISLYVNFDDVVFTEVHDNHNLDAILDKISTEKTIPTTSQPSPQNFIEKFEEVKKDGYDRIVLITLSQELSGTFQGAVSAANMFMEENPDVQVDVFDSGTIIQGASYGIFKVADFLEKDPAFPNEKIEKILKWYKDNVKLLVTLENLDFIIYSGQLGAAKGTLGNIFGISPILQVKDGKIQEFSQARGRKKALKKILETANEDLSSGEPYYVLNVHIRDEKGHQALEKEIKNTYQNITFVDGAELGPVVATKVGPGVVGMGWWPIISDEDLLK